MCYTSEYFSRIREKLPVKKICLVLAIINAVANALLLVACVYVEYRIFSPGHQPEPHGPVIKIGGFTLRRKRDVNGAIDDYLRHEGLFPTLYLIMFITAVFSILTFIFSVLICIGISKRRPGFLTAYVAYGVIISFPIVLFSLIHLCGKSNPGLSIAGLCGCVLHALYIVLVYQTRLKLVEEASLGDHIRLQEIEDIDTRQSSIPFNVAAKNQKGFLFLV